MLSSLFVDLFASLSLVGIWPRFVEPKLLFTTRLKWTLKEEHRHLKGLKIVHLSDLHFHAKVSDRFLEKIQKRLAFLQPDLILFTGDFICYSDLEDSKRLQTFLQTLTAPLGSFCTLGNHDYASYVSRNHEGSYDVREAPNPLKGVLKGIETLFSKKQVSSEISQRAKEVELHSALCKLLENTPFTLLHNATHTLPIGLNLTGLGDYALGRCLPKEAFHGYDASHPGIVLSHNPDTFEMLKRSPGEWILSGHSHGEQIHFPFPKPMRSLSRKLARLENPHLTRGLVVEDGKRLYVNRGLGCHKPFRFCSPPEITLIEAL